MSLTTEQVKAQAKLALYGIPAAFVWLIFAIIIDVVILMPLGSEYWHWGTLLFLLTPILFASSIFRLIYLQIKYPEAVREIAKPYNKIQGGMLSDVVEGVDGKMVGSKIGEIIQSANIAKPSEPAIKIRCQSCGHLNDETDKFCGECGAKM